MTKTVKTAEKTAAKKTAAKKSTAKKTTAAEVKEAAKVVEAVAEAVVKEATEKAEEVAAKVEEVKEEVKKTAKAAAKAPVKKTTVKEEVYLQYLGKEINKDDLMKTVKEIWTKQMKNKVGDMKSVVLYLKPEENRVYYVINDEVTGAIEL